MFIGFVRLARGSRAEPSADRWRAAAACLLALAGWTTAVCAAEPSGSSGARGWSLEPGLTMRHERNLFRLPDSDPTSATSDLVVIPALRLHGDAAWSLQSLHVDASLADHRYRNNRQLDYLGQRYAASWQWAFTPRLTGSLSTEGEKALSNFADFRSTRSGNLRRTRSDRLRFDLWFGGGLHLLGGTVSTRTRNSQLFTEVDTSRLRQAEFGLRYVTRSGSTLNLLRRQGHGRYPDRSVDLANALDDGFERRNTDVELTWPISEKSRLGATFGRVSQSYPHVPQRNFSGNQGRIEYVWLPAAKLRIALAARHELGEWQDRGASYAATDGYTLSPTWTITEKIALNLSVQRFRRRYRGALDPTIPARSDLVRAFECGISWRPREMFSAMLTVRAERRDSAPDAVYFAQQYAARVLTLDLRASF